MNNRNTFVSEISQQIETMYEHVNIITQLWHRADCYFTSISNTLYPITVPNMNKITTFFSEIIQQIFKFYEKIAIITQIWHKAKTAILKP